MRIAGPLAALLLLIAGCSTAPAPTAPASFDAHGTVTLYGATGGSPGDDAWYRTPDGGCSGDGGYADVTRGAAVTVWDATGRIVALGTLDSAEPSGSACVLSWVAHSVPAGVGPYQYEVTHRGKLTAVEDDLMSGVAATLGHA